MDKSDIEMEYAEKKDQEVENSLLESRSDTIDSNLKSEGSNLLRLAAKEARGSDESRANYENGVQPETEDPMSGAKSPTNGENEDEEQNNDGMVANLCNATDKLEDQKNAGFGLENQLNSRSQPEAHGNVVSVDENSSKIKSQSQNNGKGDLDGSIREGAEAQDQDKNENGERELEGDVALQNKEAIVRPAKDDTRNCDAQLPDHEVHKTDKGEVEEAHQSEKMIYEVNQNGNDKMIDEQNDPQTKTNPATVITDTAAEKMPDPVTPKFPGKPSTAKAGQHSGEVSKNFCNIEMMADDEDEYGDWDDDGSPEDQAAFMRELDSFYRERAMEFKPPKFYGHPLNLLKLWRSVIRLGGYDRATGSKLWRQVGESFNPPKTCTTVSWTFRIFYEKALLEYEKHKKQCGELQLPIAPPPDYSSVDNEGNGFQASASGGRARRDSAARAMQGWHEQRLLDYGEDKNANTMPKREKSLKSISSIKHKRQNEAEHLVKAARTETSKQLVTTVVDVGPPADWVKITVRETKDCFEVYALVPGLLREEVRVQSDPAGRLVITGQPEQLDNPWGITAFKKVVSLPGRIDPLQTSAVVSLHGRLHIRVPFAQ